MIIDDVASKNPGGVAISEIHAIATADVDGDGITDVIAGKRLFSRLDSYTDPDPHGDAVLYVFRTVRDRRASWGRDVRAAVGPQSIRRRLNGADCRFEQRRRRRHPHGDKPRHVHFWGTAKKGARAK
jgi:hypothetical protein